MTRSIRHEIRQSESVAPFGPGAIADVSGESLVAPDLSRWRTRPADEIHCDRLVDKLGGGSLHAAPSHSGDLTDAVPGLEYYRFPAWRFCESCDRMTRKTRDVKGYYRNVCSSCSGKLVPMRFVAVCESGSHLEDIPWGFWVHRGDRISTEKQAMCRDDSQLKFRRRSGAGEGLGSMAVRCATCGRERPLSELAATPALSQDGFRCTGGQPWQNRSEKSDDCDARLIAKQRGATSNYLADVVSAIEIPEGEDPYEAQRERIRAHPLFPRFLSDNGGPKSAMYREDIAGELDVPEEAVEHAAVGDEELDEQPALALKDGEWQAFMSKRESGRDDVHGDFIVDGRRLAPDEGAPEDLQAMLTHIGQVRRLREVRALQGFRRHNYAARRCSPDGSNRRRYPAIELFGEGVFLQFDDQMLARWETRSDVRRRAEILISGRESSEMADQLDYPEPRFIALHTVAHFLIRRLAFASGYSASSLQERIYASTERRSSMAGILIYTAGGDAQGTLGGLVRMGGKDRIVPLILSALSDAEICSNDPVCIESDRQGSSNLNLSACHGCALISETSCECRNVLLDRQLLFGGAEVETGLFQSLMEDLRSRA